MRRVHFDTRQKNGDPFPCGASAVSADRGWDRGVRPSTKDKDAVTCRRCRRSRAFETAEHAVLDLMARLQQSLGKRRTNNG